MAEIMTSCGAGARALRNHAASPACLSQIRLAQSDKSDGIERFLRN